MKSKRKSKIKRSGLLLVLFTGLCRCASPLPQKAGPVVQQQVIAGVLRSATGQELSYTFNKVDNTMIIHFQGEAITLSGQPTGSGIKYANDQYTYTEWQGNSTLQKDGVTIFAASADSGKQK